MVVEGTNLLEYFRGPDDRLPLGSIDLSRVVAVEACPERFGLRHEKGEYLFKVCTTERTHYMVAQDEKTMEYWINGINHVRMRRGECASRRGRSEMRMASRACWG